MDSDEKNNLENIIKSLESSHHNLSHDWERALGTIEELRDEIKALKDEIDQKDTVWDSTCLGWHFEIQKRDELLEQALPWIMKIALHEGDKEKFNRGLNLYGRTYKGWLKQYKEKIK